MTGVFSAGAAADAECRDIVVIGASAGGVEALMKLAQLLPADLPACVVLVLHVPAASPSALPKILTRSGNLPACHVAHGDPVEPGRLYVAPPDRHVIFTGGQLMLSADARVNGHRPAVDPLFGSAAREYGPRVIGIVLSGVLGDGAAGMVTIKAAGGVCVVQDPAEALYPGMPLNAIAAVRVDKILPLQQIAEFIVDTAGRRSMRLR